MLLTDAERKKFAEWLVQDAESNRLLIETMRKEHGIAYRILAANLEGEMEAELLVARKLMNTESMSIG